MILTCPECKTQYFTDPGHLGEDGRTVKCAACGHTWFVSNDRNALGASQAHEDQAELHQKAANRASAIKAWIMTSVAAVLIAALFYIFHDPIVRVWPQTASVYKALGFETNRYRMTFLETRSERTFDGTTPILEISGVVQSLINKPLKAPAVKIIMLDDQGEEVAEAFTTILPATLQPRGRAGFATRIRNPPFESFELELRFVDQAEDQQGPVLRQTYDGEDSLRRGNNP